MCVYRMRNEDHGMRIQNLFCHKSQFAGRVYFANKCKLQTQLSYSCLLATMMMMMTVMVAVPMPTMVPAMVMTSASVLFTVNAVSLRASRMFASLQVLHI